MKEETHLFSFSIELSITCPGCHRPMAVDGPLTSLPCPRCGTMLEMDREYWAETLEDARASMAGTPPGQGSASTFFGRHSGRLTLGRLTSSCGVCGKELAELERLVREEPLSCGECGAFLSVSPPPSWLAEELPGLVCLVNAKLEHEGDTAFSLVKVSCPSCSAGLEVNGKSRLVKCTWCGNSIYLSDRIWTALHGTKRIGRWFAVFSSETTL